MDLADPRFHADDRNRLLIAIPLSYYLTQNWLGHYQYHLDPSWTVFIFTAIGSMTITLLTVSYQTIQAALANPLNSIKTE